MSSYRRRGYYHSFINQWTLKRDGFVIAAGLGALLALIIRWGAGTVSTTALLNWVTFATIAAPVSFILGRWFGLSESRSYIKGRADEKTAKTAPVIEVQPYPYQNNGQAQLSGPSITHGAPVDIQGAE